MKPRLNREQNILCKLLAAALAGGQLSGEDRGELEAIDQKALLRTAERHKVLSLLYDALQGGAALDGAGRKILEGVARRTVRQNYRLLFLTRHLVGALQDAGIPAVVLKGCSVSAYYPVPELRKSGDVDLLVGRGDLEDAIAALGRVGCAVSDRQNANHHVVCRSADGIDVELHMMLAEPFDKEQVNDCIRELSRDFVGHAARLACMGVELPVLANPEQALQLLLHMLQHFLRAGFGLKLLCDWTVFWNGQERETAWPEFEQLAKRIGVYDFARVVTECCVGYLGLREEYLAWPGDAELAGQFLCDVFAAEEFGRSGKERMVALRGTGIWAYLKEFHHQMKINHPKASKHVLLWPALWAVTLFVFLYNNHRLHRGSVGDILRSADRRGMLVQRMGLWEKKDERYAGD